MTITTPSLPGKVFTAADQVHQPEPRRRDAFRAGAGGNRRIHEGAPSMRRTSFMLKAIGGAGSAGGARRAAHGGALAGEQSARLCGARARRVSTAARDSRPRRAMTSGKSSKGVKEGERVVTSGNMLIDGQAQLKNIAAPKRIAALPDPAMEMTRPSTRRSKNICAAWRNHGHARARRSRRVQRRAGQSCRPPPRRACRQAYSRPGRARILRPRASVSAAQRSRRGLRACRCAGTSRS